MRNVLIIALLLFLGPVFGYELSFDGSGTGDSGVRFERQNAWHSALTYHGQAIGIWQQDAPGGVFCDVAGRSSNAQVREEGDETIVTSQSFLGAGPAELVFRKGRLVRFRREGSDEQKAADQKLLTARSKSNSLPRLWRRRGAEEKAAWWTRWDPARASTSLWYFNPNAAGTLYAELALLVLAFALFCSKRWVKVVSGGVVPVLLVLLLRTASRGSLLAFGCGAAILVLGLLVKRFSWKSLAVAVAAVAMTVAVLLFSGHGERFGSQMFKVDDNNAQRLHAWASAPSMMAAAPDGWGADRSGFAYCDWYQEDGNHHPLYYLVNSHLTWMVERGSVFRLFYLFAWAAVLILLALHLPGRLASLALAQALCVFVSIWFSTIGLFASLWVIPGLSLVVFAALRLRRQSLWRGLLALVVSGCLAIGLKQGFESWGRGRSSQYPFPVERRGGTTTVGSGPVMAYLLHDDYVLNREIQGPLGRDVRHYLSENGGSLAIVDSPEDLPNRVPRLIVVGMRCIDYLKYRQKHLKDEGYCLAEKTIFISPPFAPTSVPRRFLLESDVRVLIGEFAAEMEAGYAKKYPWVKVVPSCGLYVEDWLKKAIGESGGMTL